MGFTLANGFSIGLKMGGTEMPLAPGCIDELTIVQDMNKFLPSFRLRIKDPDGALTHLVPFDMRMSKVSITLAEDAVDKSISTFDFTVYRRYPESDVTLKSSFDIEGLLDVPGMFSPDWSRGWNRSIGTILKDIALDELKCPNLEISPSLNYAQTIVQPRWSNAQFLKYHKENLIGKNAESNFKCFIKIDGPRKVFVFKSIDELIGAKVAYKFNATDANIDDTYPMYAYQMTDNYRIFEIFGGKTQSYSYFDYYKNTFVQAEEQAEDYNSLAQYFLFDGADSTNSNEITDTGRTSAFTTNFKGRVKAKYSERLNSACKMWVSTIGLKRLTPGSVVELVFPQSVALHTYAGFWLVESVSHSIGSMFVTTMLLTRNGFDTKRATTLVKGKKAKRV